MNANIDMYADINPKDVELEDVVTIVYSIE